jgi:hypothetical protein
MMTMDVVTVTGEMLVKDVIRLFKSGISPELRALKGTPRLGLSPGGMLPQRCEGDGPILEAENGWRG